MLEFETSKLEKGWLKEWYTGHLKREYPWEEFIGELEGECGCKMKLIPMGGKIVLVQYTSDSNIKELIEGFDERAEFWFDWIRPWKEMDVESNTVLVPIILKTGPQPKFFYYFGPTPGIFVKC